MFRSASEAVSRSRSRGNGWKRFPVRRCRLVVEVIGSVALLDGRDDVRQEEKVAPCGRQGRVSGPADVEATVEQSPGGDHLILLVVQSDGDASLLLLLEVDYLLRCPRQLFVAFVHRRLHLPPQGVVRIVGLRVLHQGE